LRSDPNTLREDRDCLLDIEKLSIFYDGLQAVWDVSFSVQESSVTALVGSNGAGKSTILQAISGILSQVKGDVWFQRRIISKLPPHRRVALGIALIPEGRRIFPYLTVQENLEIGAYTRLARAQSGLAVISEARRAEETDCCVSFRRRTTDAGDRKGIDVSSPIADVG